MTDPDGPEATPSEQAPQVKPARKLTIGEIRRAGRGETDDPEAVEAAKRFAAEISSRFTDLTSIAEIARPLGGQSSAVAKVVSDAQERAREHRAAHDAFMEDARARQQAEDERVEREVQSLELARQTAASQEAMLGEVARQAAEAEAQSDWEKQDSDRHYRIQKVVLIFTLLGLLISIAALVVSIVN